MPPKRGRNSRSQARGGAVMLPWKMERRRITACLAWSGVAAASCCSSAQSGYRHTWRAGAGSAHHAHGPPPGDQYAPGPTLRRCRSSGSLFTQPTTQHPLFSLSAASSVRRQKSRTLFPTQPGFPGRVVSFDHLSLSSLREVHYKREVSTNFYPNTHPPTMPSTP